MLEKETEQKHTGIRYKPKRLKKFKWRRPIYFMGICYLLIAAIALSTGFAFANYKSEVTVESQPLRVADFAFNAESLSEPDVQAYKEQLNLDGENAILACVFKVTNTNESNNDVCEVSMNCDLTFRATMQIDVEGPLGDVPLSQVNSLLYDEIKVKLYVDGKEAEILKTPNDTQAVQADEPMPIADILPLPMNYFLQDSDAIHFEKGTSITHTCAIVYDISKYTYGSFNITEPTNEPAITLTATQID